MGGRSWTELFFLDEATALSAGHRPCFFCRRDDANRFRAAWEKGNGVADVLARDIDAVLHRERLDRGRKRLHPLPMPLERLPDGAMVQAEGESFLIAQGRALAWSPAGYRKARHALENAMLLTPPSTLRALSAGYRPVLHPKRDQRDAMMRELSTALSTKQVCPLPRLRGRVGVGAATRTAVAAFPLTLPAKGFD